MMRCVAERSAIPISSGKRWSWTIRPQSHRPSLTPESQQGPPHENEHHHRPPPAHRNYGEPPLPVRRSGPSARTGHLQPAQRAVRLRPHPPRRPVHFPLSVALHKPLPHRKKSPKPRRSFKNPGNFSIEECPNLFLDHAAIENLFKSWPPVRLSYTHAYAAWEKRSVENANRLVRLWYPKATDLSRVSPGRIAALQMPSIPIHRKLLQGKTAHETYLAAVWVPHATVRVSLQFAPRERGGNGNKDTHYMGIQTPKNVWMESLSVLNAFRELSWRHFVCLFGSNHVVRSGQRNKIAPPLLISLYGAIST